nr:MAG TPA: hypothetical protein [Caudoviricetes sp.]
MNNLNDLNPCFFIIFIKLSFVFCLFSAIHLRKLRPKALQTGSQISQIINSPLKCSILIHCLREFDVSYIWCHRSCSKYASLNKQTHHQSIYQTISK